MDGVARKIESVAIEKERKKQEKAQRAAQKKKDQPANDRKPGKKRKSEADLQEEADRKRRKIEAIEEERIRTGCGRGGKKLVAKTPKPVNKVSNVSTGHTEESKECKHSNESGDSSSDLKPQTENPPKSSKKKSRTTSKSSVDSTLLHCTRVRIFPTAKQKKKLQVWFGGARWCYNQAVEKYNDKGVNNLTFFRQTIVNEGLHKDKETQWLLQTPTEVRTEAIRDFSKAVQSNLAKCQKDENHKFLMKFKSAKADSDSIVISKKKCKEEVALLANMKTERNRKLRISWDRDMRLCKKKNGFYFLCIPRKPKSVNENQVPELRSSMDGIIALDPGVRTFMTGYTSMGEVYEFCNGDEQRLCRLRAHYDKLQKKIRNNSNMVHKRRYRMRKAASKLQQKMSNLVDDMHRKIAKFLCENFRVIFLPKFPVQQMVTKKYGKRKISKRTVRSMYALKHYTFQQRLLNKSSEYPWVQVFIVNEAYTSKTCTSCGRLHQKLGGSKVFRCPNPLCLHTVSRDVGGARNILLRQLGVLSDVECRL
jgi:putative transposase